MATNHLSTEYKALFTQTNLQDEVYLQPYYLRYNGVSHYYYSSFATY